MNSHSKTSLHSSSQHSSENNDVKKAMKRANSIVNNTNNIDDANYLSVDSRPVFSKSLANKIANARAKAANHSSMNYVNSSSETYQTVNSIVKHGNNLQQANSKKNSLTNNHISNQSQHPTSNTNNHVSNNNKTNNVKNSVAQIDHGNLNGNPINKQPTPVTKNENVNSSNNKAIKINNNVKTNGNKKN